MIARKSFLIVLSHIFTGFLGWIGLIVLAKIWGVFAVEALGIIGFGMAFLAIFNYVADMDFTRAHIKRISEGKDLGTCIGTYATIKLFLVGLMTILIISSIFVWKNIFHEGFYDATTESVVIVFVFYYIFSNLQQIATATFEGTRSIARREITRSTESLVKFPLIILVAIAGVNIVGKVHILPPFEWPIFLQQLQQFLAMYAIGALAMTYVFGAIAVLFVGLYFLRKYPWKRPRLELGKSYAYFAFPLMFSSVIGIISVNIDKIMIGYFWTSKEVGYYFTMQQILQLVIIFPIAVCTVLFPTISEYYTAQFFQRTRETVYVAERYISMVIIPIIVVIIIFANQIITILLDSAFLPAASVLIILMFYTLISGITMPYISLIGGINRPDILAKIGFFICIINIILNYILIPGGGIFAVFNINGPVGAATATLISSFVGFFGLRLAAKRLMQMKIRQSHTPRHILAGLIMGCILYSLNFIIPLVRWYHLLIYAVIGLGIYLGFLFILREFKRQDLTFFLNLVHPKETFKYIKSELKQKIND